MAQGLARLWLYLQIPMWKSNYSVEKIELYLKLLFFMLVLIHYADFLEKNKVETLG